MPQNLSSFNYNNFQELQTYIPPKALGADYDISAFIIPPPPSSSANKNRSSDIIRRLYEAKAGISKVIHAMLFRRSKIQDL